jgi:hypothetical protein
MPKFRKSILLFMALTFILAGFSFPQSQSRAADSAVATLKPSAWVHSSGAASGAVTNLLLRDQRGTQNKPAKYVTFKTPGVIYKGYRIYTLPDAVKLATLISFGVQVNYRGPRAASQNWSWWLYDWSRKIYVKIGDNAKVTGNTWTSLNFSALNASRFVSPGRQIRLQLQSNNASGDARIDFEAINASYSTVTSGPVLSGCPVFPADNIWNAPIDTLPVHPYSSAWISSIGGAAGFHMDFGSGKWDGGPIGIPYNIVSGSQPKKYFTFYYPGESDRGPYPIPANPLIEWGSDHHVLMVDKDNCKLYEVYDASKNPNGSWKGGSGAIWNLRSNALRPAGWTSADAAGLPILPGLVRYDEIASGEIRHAIRFTAENTAGYIWPARHLTAPADLALTPPMGARFRLKASFDISGYPAQMQVILKAMQTYGIILADNGSNWYISGAPDERWNNDMLHLLDNITGNDFEAVDESGLMADPDSGQVKP